MISMLDKTSVKLLKKLKKGPIEKETAEHDYEDSLLKGLLDAEYIKLGSFDSYSFRTGYLIEPKGEAYLRKEINAKIQLWVPIAISAIALVECGLFKYLSIGRIFLLLLTYFFLNLFKLET